MGTVERVGTTIILTCPFDKVELWGHPDKADKSKISEEGQSYRIQDYSESDNGQYFCNSESGKYIFYVRAKVCKDCIELNAGTVIGIICGDLVVTFLVALSVYCFAKRRAVTKEYRNQQLGDPDVPMGRGTNIAASHQQSDYAPIKSGQRDLYDRLKR
ncbi:T-cell surface glycoprotein CD3 epsilon chain-like isoform X2 [Mustelus asterias]